MRGGDMNNKLFLRLVFALCCVLVASCEVHEFPGPKEVPFVLHLNYDTEMPLYKIVEYQESSATKSAATQYDVRYIVNVYDSDEDNMPLRTFTFTKDDVSELNNSLTLPLFAGNYRFVVWSDYVLQGSEIDMHYITDNFECISLPDGEHNGSNDMRDAFTGTVAAEVSGESMEASVEMIRPMAKFNFVSTDLQGFVTRIMEFGKVKSSNIISLEDYTVVFRYNGFMPHTYNLYTGKPSDSRAGVSFTSKLVQLNENEAALGFDYVFVNGDESVVSVAVEVRDGEGNLLSRFKPVDVPLMRSKLTTVKANFLTSSAGGGVAVDPDYDGEHNIVFD